MKPRQSVEEVGEEHVETQRQGSAVGLLTGLLILVLLAGSAIFVTYFWPVQFRAELPEQRTNPEGSDRTSVAFPARLVAVGA